ncbi:hypothetical protein WJ542_29780 [Paraburkholderia sp. B3]|uniref:hypothetical protein n=1 Tax=Paraburkholderia sp. B3 TaxID=3134791 RepID=UPI0039821576
MNSEQRTKIIRRYAIAYFSLLGIFGAFAIVSIAQGAGWRPAMAGMPLYVILFGGITFQLVRELLALRSRDNYKAKDDGDKEDER